MVDQEKQNNKTVTDPEDPKTPQEGGDTQTSLAILGIQLHTGIIPAMLMLIGTLIFWKFYDITPHKAEKIKEKLKELKL
jgi:Na+/melibiose symporter-like transporter